MELQYQIGDDIKVVRVEANGETYRVSIDDHVYDVQVSLARSGELILIVDGQKHIAHVAENGPAYYVLVDGNVVELTKPAARRARRRHHHGEDSLAASMPGQVTQVLVKEGDAVERGQPLIILEAMKMEIKIAAPHAGCVVKLLVNQGQVVDRGQALIEISADS